jgi:hypothetical protein
VESIEQEFMVMLSHLPTPITITWRSGLYHWQCREQSGSSRRLPAAVEAALGYLLSHPAVQAAQTSVASGEKMLNDPGMAR